MAAAPERQAEPDARLETKTRDGPIKTPDAPPMVPDIEVDADTGMVTDAVDAAEDIEVQMGNDDGDVEFEEDFYKVVNADAEMGSTDDHEMVAMMDVLQSLGVEVEHANQFSTHIEDCAQAHWPELC